MSHRFFVNRHVFALAAGVLLGAACSSPTAGPSAADPSSAAATAKSTVAASTPSPTPAPTPQLLDPCKLLPPEDVAAVRGPGAQPATSYVALQTTFGFGGGTPLPAPSGIFCSYNISVGPDTTAGAMSLWLCRCNASSAEFDSWAANPAVIGASTPGQTPLLISAVGERAYLLPGRMGIAFRQSGVDFVLRTFGRAFPDLQSSTGPVDPRFGRPLLAEPELTPKATAVFSAIALKILERLAASPAAAPSVAACSAGTPTVTIPAGYAFNNCREQPNETAYTWCPTGGGGACIFLRRQPFGGGHLGSSVAVDVGGKPGYLATSGDRTDVGWYDSGFTMALSVSGTQLSRDAILALAASVRPELVASAPAPTGPPTGTSTTSTTGLCATTPTVTLPSGFTFMGCREQGPTATFTWAGGANGAVVLGVLPLGQQVSNPGGTAVDINGNQGTIGSPVAGATVVVWSSSAATFYVSAGGPFFTRDAVLAFARSVR